MRILLTILCLFVFSCDDDSTSPAADCAGIIGGIAIENECGCIVGCYEDTDCGGSGNCYIYEEGCLPPFCASAYGLIPNDGTTAGICFQGNDYGCVEMACTDFCLCGCPTFIYHSLY